MFKLYKLLFTGLLLLLIHGLMAQPAQSFEGITTALNCGNSTCPYTDPGSAAAIHVLADAGGIPVSGTGTGSTMGFATLFTPSRTGGAGTDGLTDGDAFGVAGPMQIALELGGSAPDGTQIFLMEDTDGMVTMFFDYVDLTGATTPMMSMQYHLEDTGWENSDGANDRFYARVVIDNCGSATTLTLLDTDGGGSGGNAGGDIDLLGIEDSWNTLTEDLTTYVGCRAQLIIEFDSNSASEELGIDNIEFTEGARQTFILPVELVRFDAKQEEDDVKLSWLTASEIDNDYFQIEHSIDGLKYETIGRVEGNGTTEISQFYQFIHDKPIKGDNYYRLRQVDFDGQFEYSDVVHIKMNGAENDVIIYPNPVQDFVYIEKMQGSATIYDISGQRLSQHILTEEVNQLDVHRLQPGIYILELINEKGQKTIQRLVK